MDLGYYVLEINHSHRLHVSTEEVFIELCPSVVSKYHAVSVQQSQNMGLYR